MTIPATIDRPRQKDDLKLFEHHLNRSHWFQRIDWRELCRIVTGF